MCVWYNYSLLFQLKLPDRSDSGEDYSIYHKQRRTKNNKKNKIRIINK